MSTVLVAAGILLEKGSVLLTKRKKNAHLAGLWEFPGGKVEADEDPRDALVRELREEVGITVTVGEILDVTFHRYVDANRTVLLLFFEVTRTHDSADPLPLDVAEVRWAKADALVPEEFPAADLGILAKVRSKLLSC